MRCDPSGVVGCRLRVGVGRARVGHVVARCSELAPQLVDAAMELLPLCRHLPLTRLQRAVRRDVEPSMQLFAKERELTFLALELIELSEQRGSGRIAPGGE